MELRHLLAFQAVARELHFGRAAESLHISQPPLSRRIQELEEELGVRLLARTSRSVALTRAGSYFLAETDALLSRLDHARTTLAEMERGRAGRLRIGFVGPMTDTDFPEWVRTFKQSCPEVELGLVEGSSRDQYALLEKGELDLGFVRVFESLPPGFEGIPCIREPYVAALPEDHPLAGSTRLSLARLRRDPWLLFPRRMGPQLHDAVMKALKGDAEQVNVVQEVETKRTMLALCAAGMGLALVPRSMGGPVRKGVVFVPIADDLPLVDIRAVWPRGDEHPARDGFLRLVPAP